MAARKSRTSVRQRKYVNRVVALWIDAVGARSREETLSDGTQPGQHGNILLAIHAIRDRAVLDRSAERRFPENLSVVGIKCAELLVKVSPENQVAGSGQGCAVARSGTFVDPLNLSGRHIDLG